jgi:hypothetical protein
LSAKNKQVPVLAQELRWSLYLNLTVLILISVVAISVRGRALMVLCIEACSTSSNSVWLRVIMLKYEALNAARECGLTYLSKRLCCC